MKRFATNLALSFSLLILACNVSKQQPMPETPSVMNRGPLRTTAVGSIGKTSHFFTNGKKSDITAFFGYNASYNTVLMIDQPAIFATECDPAKIHYDISWALVGDEAHTVNLPTTDPDPTKITKFPMRAENTGVYKLTVHLTNTDTCQRISFKFNTYENPGFVPDTDPLVIGSNSGSNNQGTIQNNTVQIKTSYMSQASHLFMLPAGTQAQTYQLILNAPNACDTTATFALVQTDSKNNVTSTPVDLTKGFMTDPTQANGLLVTVNRAPGCTNGTFNFSVSAPMNAGPAPAPVTAPSPSPSPSPSPTPNP